MNAIKPVILGYDFVSPLGLDMDRQWEQAVAGESGVSHLTRFELREKFPVEIAGQLDSLDTEPYPFLSPRKMAQWSSPIFTYGLLVVHRALANSGIEISDELAPRVAVTFSSAVGGLDAVIDADRRMVSTGRLPKPLVNPNSCINMISGKVSILTGATGPILSTITACATGSTSMLTGAMLLQAKMADVVICGAVDCALVEPIVAGFATMNGAFKARRAPEDEKPESASRPFSIDRRGFIISEGAGCIILASEEFAKAHGLAYDIELHGWATTSDAHHFVAPNRETIARCMEHAIQKTGLHPADIDAINAHATSTKVGDQVEAQALADVFGKNVPPVSANKSQIGHAMGASSAIESLMAIRGMQTDTLLPTINYTPDPEINLDCVPEGARKLDQEFVLKNAFGFGGCNCCLVFKRV